MSDTTPTRSSETTEPLVLSHSEGGIARITLNNPAKRNVLSTAMIAALQEALQEQFEEPEVRALILSAKGPVFSSGHDMRELVGTDEATAAKMFDLSSQMMMSLQRNPKPVIAEVSGNNRCAGRALL